MKMLRLGFAAFLAITAWSEAPADAGVKPTIVYVLLDDLGWNDVGYHGSTIRTPTIDSLATSGVRLEQFYVTPMCTPTRAAFISGQAPYRLGLADDVIPHWSRVGLNLETQTIAERLKGAGYVTAIIGKWNLGHAAPAYRPTHRGFDIQFGPYSPASDYFAHTAAGSTIRDLWQQDRAVRVPGYLTDTLAREAVQLIERHDFASPLFLYLPLTAPHAPYQVDERYLEFVHDEPDRERWVYAAMVYAADRAIAGVIAALQGRGVWNDTLFVVSSDNGGAQPANNSPLRGAKRTLYQGGLLSPAILSYPARLRTYAGRQEKAPLLVTDLTATFLRAASATAAGPAADTDTVDILDLLTGQAEPPWRRVLHLDHRSAALLYGPLKVVENPNRGRPGTAAAQSLEVYDVASDPMERHDLATDQGELIQRFRDEVAAIRAKMPSPLVDADDWQAPFPWSTLPNDLGPAEFTARMQWALGTLWRYSPNKVMTGVATLLLTPFALLFVWHRVRRHTAAARRAAGQD